MYIAYRLYNPRLKQYLELSNRIWNITLIDTWIESVPSRCVAHLYPGIKGNRHGFVVRLLESTLILWLCSLTYTPFQHIRFHRNIIARVRKAIVRFDWDIHGIDGISTYDTLLHLHIHLSKFANYAKKVEIALYIIKPGVLFFAT